MDSRIIFGLDLGFSSLRCFCDQKARERPPKRVEEKVVTKDNESDTETGEEI